MKVSAIIAIVSAASSAIATTVSYDTGYDQSTRSLNAVACSDGANGLETKYGYQTQGHIPTFPNIGGSVAIAGWNSAQCGNCYKITYQSNSIFVTAIDHAAAGMNIALAAMNKLTNNQATQLGRIEATVKQVGVSKCHLTPKRDLRKIEFEA